MRPNSKVLLRVLALCAFAFAALPSHAEQKKNVYDGATVEAVVAMNEPTRIRVDGAKIIDVVGNIYSSSCAPKGGAASPTPAAVNSQGEFVLGCDLLKGEIFVRPVGKATKPINLFVSTERATYTLLLRRADVPAGTIVLVDKNVRMAQGNVPRIGKAATHVRALKAMLLIMTGTRSADEVTVEELGQTMRLWREARFELVRQYNGLGMVGEEYRLTNTSNGQMVLAEQEFDREQDGVLGVAIERMTLQPREQTAVYVIRSGE